MAPSKTRSARAKKRRQKPIALDLFAGCGGLTLGLKQAGFRILGAVEVDPMAVRTYKANHPSVRIKQTDIRDVVAQAFRRELKLRPGELDLLAGCPPCQGFSALRTRNGSSRNRDKRNDLVNEMVRFARAFRPKAVMMENVPGLVTRKGFKKLCTDLKKLGYRVNFAIKDAARYGVPQRRRRLMLLAGHKIKIAFGPETDRSLTVRNAIGRLSKPGLSSDKLHNLPEKKRTAKIANLIRDIPKNGGSRGDLPKHRQLKCHKASNGFNDIYGRMSWDAVAPTITSGCFNPSKGRFLHPQQNRAITMREAARLQGFPGNYYFELSAGKQAIALMIGNALPPEFIKRNAQEIRGTLRNAK